MLSYIFVMYNLKDKLDQTRQRNRQDIAKCNKKKLIAHLSLYKSTL